MEHLKSFIEENKFFASGETIGVAVSGGSDSMTLLHFLHKNKDELDIEIVALHLDHSLRENSGSDAAFVTRWCKENGIRLFKQKIDVNELCKLKKLTIEQGARVARYEFFDGILKKNVADKIVLAHHISDQAETVLLNLLRGSGLSGARGMDLVRGKYIRPMLKTTKGEILKYIYDNKIEYIDDESNSDIRFSRNFLRHKIMPLLAQRWQNVEMNLSNFAKTAREDDEYINQFASIDSIIINDDNVKIPLTYFTFASSIIWRVVTKSLAKLQIEQDFERKHLTMLKELVTLDNGSKVDLPNGTKAYKEYDYITIVKKKEPKLATEQFKFKIGKTVIDGFGTINIKTIDPKFAATIKDKHIIDLTSLPKNSVWRMRQEGDYLAKFGGGTKKLKAYLIEKKVPVRLRNTIPVLASDNEVYVIACLAISGKLKVTDDTKTAYSIEYLLN